MSTIAEQLKATCLLQTPEECDQFEEALAEVDPTDLSLLPTLYEVFDNETEQPGLMWQLVHLIESFEEETRLSVLVEQTPLLREQASNWLKTLWARTLNSAEARIRLQYEIIPLLEDKTELLDYLRSEASLWPKAESLF